MASSSLFLNLIVREDGNNTSTISNVTKGFLGITAAVGGLGLAMGSSISKAGDFDATIRQVGAATKVPAAGLAELSDLALKMGADTSFSAQEAADAMLELAKGGLTAAQIKAGVLQSTLTLAAAGGLQLGDAATYMSNALNTFGLGADQAATVAAALAGGANASTASVESLGQALSQVGPGATQAGLSLQQTVAVLAAFDNAGIKGSDAGTSLKTMLTRLIPTSKEAGAAMRQLGLNFTDSAGNMLPIGNIADQLKSKLSGLSDAQRTQALATIFGSDATRAATVLMNLGSTGLAKYTKATTDLGAAQDMAKVKTSGWNGAVEQFKGSVDTLQIAVGQKFLPLLTPLLNKMTGVVNEMTAAVDPAADFAANIGSKLAPGLKNAADGLGVFWDALKGDSELNEFDGNMRTVNNIGIRTGEGLRTAWATLDTAWDPAKAGAARLFDYLRGQIGGINWDPIKRDAADTWGVVRDTVGQVNWKSIGNSAADMFKTGWEASNLGDIGAKIAADAAAWGQAVIGGVVHGVQTGDWSGLGAALGEGLANRGEDATQIALGIFTLIGTAMESVPWFEVGLAAGKGAWTLLAGFALGLLQFDIGAAFAGFADHWKETLFGILTLATLGEGAIGARIGAKISGVLRNVPLAGRLLSLAFDALRNFSEGFVRIGATMLGRAFEGFWAGIREAFPAGAAFIEGALQRITLSVAIWVGNIARAIDGAPGQIAGKLEQIGGAFFEAGGRLGARLLSGVVKAVVAIPREIINTIRGSASGMNAVGGALVIGLWNGMADQMQGFFNWLGKWPGWIFSWLNVSYDWMINAGKNIVIGLWNGIASLGGWLKDKVSGFLGNTIGKLIPHSPVAEGPLTVLNNGYAGGQVVKMLAAGIAAHSDAAVDAMRDVTAGVADAAKGLQVGSAFTVPFQGQVAARLLDADRQRMVGALAGRDLNVGDLHQQEGRAPGSAADGGGGLTRADLDYLARAIGREAAEAYANATDGMAVTLDSRKIGEISGSRTDLYRRGVGG